MTRILVLLGGLIVFAGCESFNPRRDVIPLPPKSEWCKYTAIDLKNKGRAGVWLDADSNDTLVQNIRNLRDECAKLRDAVSRHNGGK